MASKKLVEARIAETTAQRAYDLATHILTVTVAVVAIGSPIMVGLFLYSTGRLSEERATASALAESAQVRADTFVKECLSATSKPLIDYYCERRDRMLDLASSTNENFSRSIRASADDSVSMAFGAILLLVVASAFDAFLRVRRRSSTLAAAQTKRLTLEAEAEEASKPAPARPSRRIAGRPR